MEDPLDLATNPWLSLLSPGRVAELRAERGAERALSGTCVHGRPIGELLSTWRYEALDAVPAPTCWASFAPERELWFAYLDPAAAAACTAEFAALSSADAPADERERAFYSWRSTGAICSYPELRARITEPVDLPDRLSLERP